MSTDVMERQEAHHPGRRWHELPLARAPYGGLGDPRKKKVAFCQPDHTLAIMRVGAATVSAVRGTPYNCAAIYGRELLGQEDQITPLI